MKPTNRLKLLLPCMLMISALGATPGCGSVFDQCVKPEITAATKLAPADVAKEVAAFLICDAGSVELAAPCAVSGLADLAAALGPGGDAAVNCIVAYYEQNGTGLQQSRAKAVGAKRGVNPEASAAKCDGYALWSPGDSAPPGGPTGLAVADWTATNAPLTYSAANAGDLTGWRRVRGGALLRWGGADIGWEAVTVSGAETR